MRRTFTRTRNEVIQLAALAALSVLSLFDAPTANAQTAQTLVSNRAHAEASSHFGIDRAQPFTTGTNSAGYTVTSVTFQADDLSSNVEMTIREWDGSTSQPGNQIGNSLGTLTLTRSGTTVTGTSAGIDLAAETTYAVIIDGGAQADGNYQRTASDAENPGAAPGWSIGDTSIWRGSGGWSNSTTSFSMAIIGTINTASDTTAPTFSSASVNGDKLTITFTEALGAASNLANTAFTVNKTPSGGNEETVSLHATTGPSISSSTVVLTLATAVVPTDGSVKVSYTKPGTGTDNKIKDASDNEAESFSDQAVANDTVPTITISGGAAVTEGTAAEFTVTADNAPGANLTVNLTVADASGSDFVAAGDQGNKTVTINSGDTTATYSVTTQADTTDEPNGDVTVTVATGTGYTVGSPSSASVTVNDDDDPADTTPPTFSSASVNGDELIITFDEALKVIDGFVFIELDPQSFTVKKTPLGGAQVEVSLDEDEEVDISGKTVTLWLETAVVSSDGSIKVSYDKPDSGTHNKIIDAAGNETASFSDQPVTNDTPPIITISGGSAVTEGTAAEFTVTASSAPSANLTVNLTVADASGSDFVASSDEGSKTVTINSGATTATYSVDTVGDTTDETDGNVTVTVTSGTGYTVGTTSSATVTVNDDDDPADTTPPTFSSASVNGDKLTITFNETLGAAGNLSNDDFTVTVAILASDVPTEEVLSASTGPSISGSTVVLTLMNAVRASDYEVLVSYEKPSSGTNNKIIDAAGNETADFSDQPVTNDTPPIITISGGSAVTEGTAAEFTVTASSAPSADLTVNLSVADAAGTSDFVASGDQGNKTVTINSGDTTATYSVTTQADTTDEPNGDVTVTVATGTGYTVGSPSSASVTVNDDDDPPDTTAPTFSTASVNGAKLTITFNENLAAASDLANTAFTVKKTPSGGSEADVGLHATTGPSISGSTVVLTLATAVVSTDGSVKVSYTKPTSGSDNKIEDAAGNEANSFSDQAVTNETVLPTVTIAAGTSPVTEGTAAEFTVTASPAPSVNLVVNLTVFDVGGSDFVAKSHEGSKTVTIAANTTTAIYSVPTVNDNNEEPNSFVLVRVDTGTGYMVPQNNSALVDVNDDDPANLTNVLVSSIGQPEVAGGLQLRFGSDDFAQGFTTGSNADGYTLESIDLKLVNDPEGVSVKLLTGVSTTSTGTVVATLTNPASVSNGHITFSAPENTTVTASTTYYVLMEGSNGEVARTSSDAEDMGAAAGWSLDNEIFTRPRMSTGGGWNQPLSLTARIRVHGTAIASMAPTITISGGDAVTEGTAAEFTVTASPAPSANLTVNLTVADASGSDFVASGDEGSKTVTINSGATTATYSVTTQSDTTDEPNGDVTVTVASGTGYAVGTASSATVTVNDDDDPPARATITGVAITSTPVHDANDNGTPDTYLRGDNIEVTVTWDRDVTWDVSATNADLRVRLTIGSTNRTASLVTGGATSGTAGSVSDYDLRYFAGTTPPTNAGDWIEEGETNGPPNPGSGTSATITGLTAGTTYLVQVRAEGDDLESSWSASGSGAPATTAPTITIAAGTSPVTEGTAATFTVTADSAPSANLTVNLTVADAGGTSDFLASSNEGSKTVTINSGSTTATYSVDTVGDSTDEPNGDVTVTLATGTGYTVGTTSSASVTVNDDDVSVSPTNVLVSTIGQSDSGGQGNLSGADAAQAFTTGSNSGGYTLESIALDFREIPSGLSVKLATGLSSSSAGTVVATLTNPSLSTGILTFTAPANTTLSASTTYWVVIEGTGGIPLRTDSNAEDTGAAAGWSVADGFLWRQAASSGGWSTGTSTYRIRVNGTATAAALPTITIAAGTSPVTEGTAATFTVTADSAPSANLAVSLTVADASGSDFVASGDEGSKTVTINSGATTATYSVTTQGDSTDEPNGDVTVTVASGTGYTVGTNSSASVTVNDDDAAANTPPVFTSQPTTANVDENSANGTAVQTGSPAVALVVTATDADAGDTPTYSLDATSDNVFDIDASTGAITVQVESGSALDHEATSSITATVTATDSSNATATHDVTITVNDADEPPDAPAAPTVAAASSTSVTVSWTAPGNTGKPAITDYDVRFRASGVTNWTAHAFSGTGTSTTISSLSAGTTYQAQVMAKNAEGDSDWSATGSGTTSANNAPTFSGQPTTATVPENSANGTAVQTGSPAVNLTITATETDTGDSVTYSLDSTSDNVFDIDSSSGAITVQVESGSALDHEATSSITATVTATDTSNATATHSVTITVADANEPPSAPAAPTVTGASPTSVTVSWTAPANTGKPAITDYDVRFKLSAASDWTNHAFTGTGTSTTISSLSAGNTYQAQVMAKNAEGSSAWSATGSGATNANNAPTFSGQPATATVTENSANGTAVQTGSPAVNLTITATETDTGDSVTYSLDSTSDNVFDIDSSSGAITVQVESGSALDHEATSSITATVTATDTSNATATHSVTITVADDDEPPSAPAAPTVNGASSTSVSVSWTAPTNTGKPAISDYDLRFRVSGASSWTAHSFTGTGTSTTISSLNPGTTYQVQVMAKNDEGSSAWSTAGSGATDANNPPTFSGQPTTATVTENSADGTAVQTGSPAVALVVTATDPDSGDTRTYSLDSTADNVFDIDSSSGAITVQVESGSALDHEATPSITVTVTATDSHNATATHNVTITVADEDEPPDTPNAPTVSTLPAGEQARPVSVKAEWTAPDATGIPPITGYEVEFRESTATAWTSHTHTGSGVSTTIGSLADRLKPSTQYDVRVKANNDEGDSGWSAAGTGTTAPPDTTGPSFSSAAVNRTALEVVFDENLDAGSVPGTGSLRVTVNGGLTTFSGTLSIAGATVSGTLETGVPNGATVTVAYTKRDSGAVLEDPFGNDVESFTAQSVTNNTPSGADVTAPRFSSATVDGTALEVVFDEALDSNSRPAGSAFAVDIKVNTPNEEQIAGTGTVSISGSTVSVTLAKAVPPGAAFVVYTPPTSNPLQDAAGNQVLTMTRRQVQNDSSSAPAFAADTATRTVAENTAAGANVGAAVTADEPDGDELTYSLAGTSASLFEIGASSGQITVGSGTVLNFEATPRYQVTVQVTDGEDSGGVVEPTPSIDDSISVTIEVGDLNEPPPTPDAPTVTVASSSSLDVSWTAPADTDDRPPINDYDVEYQASSDSIWINHEFTGTGTGTTIPGLSGGTTYAVRVKANNEEGGSDWSASGSATTDLPDPTITISGGSAVTEGTAATFTVTADRALGANLTVNLTVADAPGSSDFVAAGDEGAKTVTINSGATTATYTVATVADATDEPNGPVTVTVVTGDGYTVGTAASAGVTVNDDDGENNNSPEFTGQPESASVDENSADGTPVLTVTASDPGDTISYSLDSTSDAVFDIDSSTGAITVQLESGSALDYESTSSYTATVTATDSADNTATHVLTISVNDLDEPPDAPTGVTVTGASPTSVDVSWTATDVAGRPAISDYDVQYRVSGTDDWTAHDVTGTATSTTIPDLDPGTTYEVQVLADNGEGDSDWSATASGATIVNNAPVFTGQPTTATVAENSANGAAVVTITATEPDTGDSVTYSLDSASDTVFDIDASSGAITVQVASGAALDHESTSSYTATVTATDSFDATATHEVTISVTDVDEPPDAPAAPTVAAASLSSVTASWTAPANTGKPAITDFDVRYRLSTATEWTDHEFTGTGASTTIPDLAAGSTYQVQVRATNADGTGDWSATGSGTTDSPTNSAPTFTSPPDSLEVAENSAAGTAVGQVAATDSDADDTLSFSLDTASAGVFSIDNAGNITVTADNTLDYETTPSYTVTVTVTDGEAQATHSVTINVTDVDETPVTPPELPPVPMDAGSKVSGSTVTVEFDRELDPTSMPAPEDFTVTVTGGDASAVASRTPGAAPAPLEEYRVTAVSIRGSAIELTVSPPVPPDRTVSVSYTPGEHPLRAADGAEVEEFTLTPENETPTTPPPPPTPPANQAPAAEAGDDASAAAGADVTLDGSASADPDGDALTWSWTQTAGASVTLSGANTAQASFTAPAEPGALSFRLTVTDSGGLSAEDTVTVTVQDAAPDFGGAEVAALSLDLERSMEPVTLPAASGGNGALSYGLTSSPAGLAGLVFDATTRTLSGTPLAPGSYTFIYRAEDADANRGDSDAASLTFRVTVSAGEDRKKVLTHALAGMGQQLLSNALDNIGARFDEPADTNSVTVAGQSLTSLGLFGEGRGFGGRGYGGNQTAWGRPAGSAGMNGGLGPARAFGEARGAYGSGSGGGYGSGMDRAYGSSPNGTYGNGSGSPYGGNPNGAYGNSPGSALGGGASGTYDGGMSAAPYGGGASGSYGGGSGGTYGGGGAYDSGTDGAFDGGSDGACRADELDPQAFAGGGAPSCGLTTRTIALGGSPDQLLQASAFSWGLGAAANGKPQGPRWSVWGRGDLGMFQGRPDAGSGYDGDMRTGWLGVDARTGPWVAGVALSRSTGDADYHAGGGAGSAQRGRLEIELTSVYPYVRWAFGNGIELQGLLGAGSGDARHFTGRDAPEDADLKMRLGSLGVRGPMAVLAGLNINARADLGFVRMETGDGEGAVHGLTADAWRARFGFEASRQIELAPLCELVPFVEVAGRQDSGDGLEGAGVEMAGGVRFINGRFQLEARGRVLALHSADGAKERGLSLTAQLAPRADGGGLSLSLTPRWGASASPTEALWRHEMPHVASHAGAETAVLGAQAGYGFVLSSGLLTSFTEANLAGDDNRVLRAGLRYEAAGTRLQTEFLVERHESLNAPTDHGLRLNLGIGF